MSADEKPLEGEVTPPRKEKKKKGWTAPREPTEEEKKQRQAFARIVEAGRIDDEFYIREPTPEERTIVRSMVFAGISEESICGCLGISDFRLKHWFERELQFGRDMMIADITYSLAMRAKLGSDSAAIFLLRSRGGPAFNDPEKPQEDDNDTKSISRKEKDRIISSIVEIIAKASAPVEPTK